MKIAKAISSSDPGSFRYDRWSIPSRSSGLRVPLLSLFLNLLLLCRLLCCVLVLGLADWWVRGDLPVSGAGWASRAWPGGFRRTGRKGHLRAQVAKPAPDPGWGQPPGCGGFAFPGAA